MTNVRRGDFDAQAGIFDDRAGVGDRVARRVAQAVVGLSGIGWGEVFLEIGAGTGEIGRHLALGPGRYVAVDDSLPMLTSRRWQACTQRIVANCDDLWPIADASVHCVFAARVAHLLNGPHLIGQLTRIGRGDWCFILGRTRRMPDGFKELLRNRMRQSLTNRGIQPREGRLKTTHVIETMTAAGAQPSEPVDVADWTVRGTPRGVLEAWRRKPGLGGVTIDSTTRDAVLTEVKEWAEQRFGDLDASLESREVYTLIALRMKNSEFSTLNSSPGQVK